jgi:hypothetical protein
MTKSRDLANAATALNAVTATELGFVDGVTSAIQTQIDTKLATATAATTYVANSLADAKGDLFVASADNTVTRLPVGNSGEQIVADSSTSTGLRYQGSMAGGKNAIINGGFDIWQRGTSTSTSQAFAADRWQAYLGTGTGTWSRQSVNDSTNLPSIQYCMRVQRNSGQTTTSLLYAWQNMETAQSIPLAGKTVTFSFYARKGADYSASGSTLFVTVRAGTGTDQNAWLVGYTGQTEPLAVQPTLTTTWQRFSVTATVSGTITEFAPAFSYAPTGTAGTNDYFEVTGVQFEVGSVPTQFTRAGGTIQGELAACQRYYWRTTSTASNNALSSAAGTFTTLEADAMIKFPVTMRTTPTTLDSSSVGFSLWSGGFYTMSSVTLYSLGTNTDYGYVYGSITSGPAANSPGYLKTTSSTGYLGFGAEL